MSELVASFKRALRRQPMWLAVRRSIELGWRYELIRRQIVPRILETKPMITRRVDDLSEAECEVRILTYDADYLMALWTAKSFYHFAQVDYPLVWHEGGVLSRAKAEVLLRHFPNSRVITKHEADARVERMLTTGGFHRSLAARRKSVPLLKLFDFALLSAANAVLMLDSDVLFFQKPNELVEAVAAGVPINLFNRDLGTFYTLTRDAARERLKVDLIEELNCGLGLVKRAKFSLNLIERYLHDEEIFSKVWVTEQTLQALYSSAVGVALLPETYKVAVTSGLTTSTGEPLVAKHYPSSGRPFLYDEGMRALIERGFLQAV